ncbi:hypothetical protein [Haematobacter genomosp. 1]|uniref:hypothetical protein n=1 Tax=Haematobacter genomosp. 1 TaxID=366618 RepID=UPI00117A280D|nr:hypothetical protein [Haematobacter genomosp. 1]
MLVPAICRGILPSLGISDPISTSDGLKFPSGRNSHSTEQAAEKVQKCRLYALEIGKSAQKKPETRRFPTEFHPIANELRSNAALKVFFSDLLIVVMICLETALAA